jgi:fructokinase
VAAQLAADGVEARLVSAVGDDDAGQRARVELRARGVDTAELQVLPGQHTARVKIRVGSDGEPRYSPDRRLEWGELEFAGALTRACHGSDALLFSAFAQHSPLELALLARLDGPRCIGCDLNLRRPVAREVLVKVASSADFVKLNLAELELARSALGGEDPVAWFLAQGRTRWVAVTRGAAGASLTTASLHLERRPTEGLTLRDAVGAGDAFFAGLGRAALEGASPEIALERAAVASERQIAERGGLPASI